MQAMQPFFRTISQLEGFEFFIFWLGLFVGTLIAGYITDNIMGRAGFGPVFNGIIASIGVFGGVFLHYNYFLGAPYYYYEPYMTMGLCAITPTALLILLGAVRARLG